MSLIIVKNTKTIMKSRGLKSSDEVIKALDAAFKKIVQKTADNTLAKKMKIAKASHVPKIDLHSNADSSAK